MLEMWSFWEDAPSVVYMLLSIRGCKGNFHHTWRGDRRGGNTSVKHFFRGNYIANICVMTTAHVFHNSWCKWLQCINSCLGQFACSLLGAWGLGRTIFKIGQILFLNTFSQASLISLASEVKVLHSKFEEGRTMAVINMWTMGCRCINRPALQLNSLTTKGQSQWNVWHWLNTVDSKTILKSYL